MLTNRSITKRNELIESSYRLSLNEARIVLYGLSLINPLSKQFPLEYKIDVKDFSDMFGIDSHNIYNVIKETVMGKFWDREFTYQTEHEHNVRARWLISVEYADNEGYLKIFMNPKLQPFLHQLKGSFTTYQTSQISSFKSVYSIRFYEISLMHLKKSKHNKHSFKIDVEDIKKTLELSERYKRFCDFKRYVLDQAKKEINKNSDIKLTYEVIKQGRTPREIKFTITKKEREPGKTSCKKLSTVTIEKAKDIVLKAGTGWDLYVIEQQFYDHSSKAGPPENLEGAFLGFVKKKVAKKP